MDMTHQPLLRQNQLQCRVLPLFLQSTAFECRQLAQQAHVICLEIWSISRWGKQYWDWLSQTMQRLLNQGGNQQNLIWRQEHRLMWRQEHQLMWRQEQRLMWRQERWLLYQQRALPAGCQPTQPPLLHAAGRCAHPWTPCTYTKS